MIRTIELAGPGRPIFEKLVWWEDGGELVPLVRERLRREAASWESDLSRLADLLAAEDAGEQAAVAEMEKDLHGGIRGAHADDPRAGSPQRRPQALHHRLPRPRRSGYRQLRGVPGRRGRARLREGARHRPPPDRSSRWWRAFEVLASSIGAVLAGDALGLGTVAAVFSSRPEKLQPFFVLMWLALREDPALHEGMLKTMAALPDALAMRDAFEAIRLLRAEVPALSTVMTDEALGAALLDASRGERLRAEIAEVSSMNQVSVDRIFEQHPEVAAIMEA